MAMPTSLSSSSSANQWTHDVFLSFWGIYTRSNFIGRLYKALCEKEISTFMDEGSRKGGGIKPALIKAIKESRIVIVIFSEKFASSWVCLDELVMIMDCLKRKGNYQVLPVFYKVSPSDVRHQKGSFKEALDKHETIFGEKKLQEWRSALEEAGNLPCWHFTEGQEYKLIQDIVEEVSEMINDRTSSVANYPHGSGSTFQQKSMANSPVMVGTSAQSSKLQTSPSTSHFGPPPPWGPDFGPTPPWGPDFGPTPPFYMMHPQFMLGAPFNQYGRIKGKFTYTHTYEENPSP